jgi:hypothetical protein
MMSASGIVYLIKTKVINYAELYSYKMLPIPSDSVDVAMNLIDCMLAVLYNAIKHRNKVENTC